MNKDKWLHGLALALSLALLIWAGHSLARMMWSLLASPVTAASTASWALAEPAVSARVSAEDLARLESAYVFSRSDMARRNPSSPQSITETRLSVTLHGTVVATDPAFSHAIMSVQAARMNSAQAGAEGDTNRQGVYRVGDDLKEVGRAVMVRSIHADHVMLDNNGREEVLWLFGQRSDDAAATVQAAPTTVETIADTESLVSDPQTLARLSNILRLQFVQGEGTAGGLRIRYGSRQDLLTPIGLAIGDTITAVNEQPVAGPESLMQLSRQLQQGATVRLTVEQQGDQRDVELAPHMLSHR